MNGPALFPVSLSNQDFSTENALPAVAQLFDRHEEVVFFVADHLQLYNKATTIDGGPCVGNLITKFDGGRNFLEQRTRWIERLIGRLDPSVSRNRWIVRGVDEIADSDCFRIFRNVMIAYYTDRPFRDDVDAAALRHVQRRSEDPARDEQRELLSRGYLLEEIALSVRLHITAGIRYEYYLGEQIRPVLNLYFGGYDFNACDLAERSQIEQPILFFYLNRTGEAVSWLPYRGA